MISVAALLHVALLVLVVGLIFWLATWLIDFVRVPEPFNKVARAAVAFAAVLFLIGVLLHLVGVEVFRP